TGSSVLLQRSNSHRGTGEIPVLQRRPRHPEVTVPSSIGILVRCNPGRKIIGEPVRGVTGTAERLDQVQPCVVATAQMFQNGRAGRHQRGGALQDPVPGCCLVYGNALPASRRYGKS